MVYGTFPFAKFTFLMIKQITNHVQKGVVIHAQKSNILRNYMCLPLAKWYSICDIRIRYRHQNWRKIQKEVTPDEKKSIENGAYILAEIIMGMTISIILFVEYNNYNTQDRSYAMANREEKNRVIERLRGLEETAHKQSIQLDQLSEMLEQLRANICVRNLTKMNNTG